MTDATEPRAQAGRRATILDVAKAAGVSIKTVSRVVNDEPNVRPETRQAVRDAVVRLRFQPNLSARSLAGARSFLLGLLFDNPSLAYVSDLQFGAVSRCRLSGYHLVVEPIDCTSPSAGEAALELAERLRVDGLILTPPVCDSAAVLDALESVGAEYVRIAPSLDPGRSARVFMDDAAAARQMTRRLLELGHRRIGFIRGPTDHAATHLRHAGFAAALAAFGLTEDAELVRPGDFSFRSGALCAHSLLELPHPPTAIFASNDDMALGAMSAAHQRGVALPDALSISGFDDSSGAQVVWPTLTTVRQPIRQMGAAAADILIARRAGASDTAAERLLDFEICMRDSTAPPAGATG